jgi:hypothetical protein
MQEVRDSMTSGERGPVSPIKAFLVLGAVVVATIGVIIATRPDPPAATQQPNSASVPTEAEAIQIFNDLHELWLHSYRERDATLLKLYAAPKSDMRSPDQIQLLRREHVLDKTEFDEHSATVTRIDPRRIEIEQDVTVKPRLVDDRTGEDRTVDAVTERRTVVWELRRYGDQWLIFSSTITAADPIS